RRIDIDGQSFAVVGVMPDDYEFPRPWSMMTEDPELWVPLVLPRDDSARGWHYLAATGRLKDGVSVEQAEADLKRIAAGLAELYPNSNARVDVWIESLTQRSLGYVRTFLIILLAVVGLVLLIACANVASMLLARGTTRMNELAIRASMGAGRGRLVRLLLTESLVLSLLGGVIGVVLAMWGVAALKDIIPPYIPRTGGIAVDGGVLAFAVSVSLATGLLFGLVPALFASRIDLVGALREGRGSQTGARKHNRTLGALVAGQLATAFVLANGAGLLITSYANVHEIPLGFDTEQVLVAGISTNGPQYGELEQRLAFWDQLIERVEALPGVEHAAATNKLPTIGGNNGSILVEGEAYDPDARRPLVEYSYVSPGYFQAMGIDLLSGRLIEDQDRVTADALESVSVVVNQAFVERYWPAENPLGKRIRSNDDPPNWTATVVGVVENVPQWGVEYEPLPEIYFHYSFQIWNHTQLVVRAGSAPLTLAPLIRQQLLQLDRQVPLAGARTMGDVLSQSTERRRFFMTLVSLFAVTALVLAIAGTYGVMSYYVSRRTHEVGVRVALGAGRLRLLRLFLLQGLRFVGQGITIGVLVALASAQLTSALLFGVNPFNPLFLAGSALFMIVVALLAISVPVLRALRVDPNEALRTE
ncbi:MAG TPA: ABC transporter permease, partial [Gemmatimonadota bacterium]|nr:ABC transporter permease [Gemmatimonadota bacterium]